MQEYANNRKSAALRLKTPSPSIYTRTHICFGIHQQRMLPPYPATPPPPHFSSAQGSDDCYKASGRWTGKYDKLQFRTLRFIWIRLASIGMFPNRFIFMLIMKITGEVCTDNTRSDLYRNKGVDINRCNCWSRRENSGHSLYTRRKLQFLRNNSVRKDRWRLRKWFRRWSVVSLCGGNLTLGNFLKPPDHQRIGLKNFC